MLLFSTGGGPCPQRPPRSPRRAEPLLAKDAAPFTCQLPGLHGGGEGTCWRGAGEGCWPTATQLRAQQAERAAAFGALGFSRPRHAEEACFAATGATSAACTGGLTRLHRLSEFLRMGDACGKFPPSWPAAQELGVE